DPVAESEKLVAAEPSPQSTETAHGLSGPGSEKEPRSKECDAPSFEDWFEAALTVGLTLATSTTCTASESVSLAPSESATLMCSSVGAGPFGKRQSKLPALFVCESLLLTPFVPQLVATELTVSRPGSLIV